MSALVIPLNWFRPKARANAAYQKALRAYADAEARQDTRAMHHAAADLRAAMTKRLEVRA